MIPSENVEDLMLRDDVIEAVAAGKVHIMPVTSLEQGIEILTGVRAGGRDSNGAFERAKAYRRETARAQWRGGAAYSVRARGPPPARNGHDPEEFRVVIIVSSSRLKIRRL